MQKQRFWATLPKRHLNRRRVLAAAVSGAGLAGMTVLGCAGPRKQPSRSTSGAKATLQNGGQFNTALRTFGPLDPQKVSATPQQMISGSLSRIFQYQTSTDPTTIDDHRPIPHLGVSAESPDGITWTVKLRPDVTFQNIPPVGGHAVEAEDIKATFMRMLDPATAAPNRGALSMIDPAQVQTPDKTTVVFKLAYPFAPFRNLLASPPYAMIYPREALAGAYDPATRVIGSGPFILDSVTPDVALVYKKNPDYFEKALPYVDEIRLAIIEDSSQQLAQFSGGNLDELTVRIDDLAPMQQRNPKATVIKAENASPFPLYFQLGDPSSVFQDIRLRRALSMAIDRDALGKAVFGGEYQQVVMVPTYLGKWSLKVSDLDQSVQQYYKYNPAEAKKLLTAAMGAAQNNAGAGNLQIKVGQITGGPFNAPFLKKLSETIFNMVQAVGIKATLVGYDYTKDFLDAGRGVKQGFYDKDTVPLCATASFTDPDEFLFSYFHSKSTSNTERLKDADLDAMIDKERTLLNPDERLKAVIDIQKYIADKMYVPSTVGTYNWVMVQPRVRNYQYTTTPAIPAEAYAKLWLQT